MGKKNIFIGLSTLLLVLLLGLFTRTYADTYRIWTDDDVKNVIYNYYTSYRNLGETNTTNFIENNQTTIETLVDKLNNTTKIVICSINNYGLVFQFPVAGNPGYYIANNGLQINNRAQGDISYYLGWNSLSVSTRTNLADFSSWKFNENFLYTTLDIKQNNAVKYAKGYYAPTLMFDGPYAPVEDGIRFIPYPTKISDVYIAQNYNLTAYGCSKYNTYKQTIFGDLIQPPGYLIDEINVTMAYYNRGKSKWVEKFLLLETGEDLVPSNYKSSIANFKWQNYDSSTYTITFRALIDNEYVHDDCLYFFTFIGADSSGTPFYIEQAFYIIGSNTIITDGTLDISFLTNGDYSNEYANDLNELASKIDDQNDLINAVEQGNINSWLPSSR